MKFEEIVERFEATKEQRYKKLLEQEQNDLKRARLEKMGWTEELENKLQNAKASMEVSGFHLTEEELDMIRKKHLGEITHDEYMAWAASGKINEQEK